MAILTWRDVAMPDLNRSTQEGVRTVSQLLDRAVRSGTKAVGHLEANELAQKQAEIDAANKSALEAILGAQTPEQVAQAQAQGTFLGARPDLISNEMLMLGDARAAQTAVRNNELYKIDRAQRQDRGNDALMASLGPAAVLAPTNRSLAHGILASANASPEAALAAHKFIGFDQPGRGPTEGDRKHLLETQTAWFTQQLLEQTTPEGALELFKGFAQQSPDHALIAQNAIERVNKLNPQWSGALNTNLGNAAGTTSIPFSELEEGYDKPLDILNPRAANAAASMAGSDLYPGDQGTWGDGIRWRSGEGDQGGYLKRADQAKGNTNFSTAHGPAQITDSTFAKVAPDVLGPNWRNQKANFEDYRLVAQGVWNRKGEAGLGPQAFKAFERRGYDMKEISKASFHEIEPLLYLEEGGRRVPKHKEALKQSQQALTNVARELDTNPIVPIVRAAQGQDKITVADAAKQVLNDLGLEKEVSVRDTSRRITKLIGSARESGIKLTPAEAGKLLANYYDTGWLDMRSPKELEQALNQFNATRTNLQNYDRRAKELEKATELAKKLETDEAAVHTLISNIRATPGNTRQVIHKYRKLLDGSNELAKLVHAPQMGPVKKPASTKDFKVGDVDLTEPQPIFIPDSNPSDQVSIPASIPNASWFK